jgi:hypothetical protein
MQWKKYHDTMHDGDCHLAMMILKRYLIFLMLSCWHDSNEVLSWHCHFFVFSRQHGGVWHEKMMRLFDVMVILWEVIMMKWWCYHDDMLKLSWWHEFCYDGLIAPWETNYDVRMAWFRYTLSWCHYAIVVMTWQRYHVNKMVLAWSHDSVITVI